MGCFCKWRYTRIKKTPPKRGLPFQLTHLHTTSGHRHLCRLALLLKLLPNCAHIPAIAVTRTGFGEGRKMGTKLKGAVIPVLEQGFAVNAKEFFRLLNGDPSWCFGHGAGNAYFYRVHRVNSLSTLLIKALSLYSRLCMCGEIKIN